MLLKNNQKGFTLVELLLATVVFSVALIAITAAIIQLFKAYQAGISIRKTQTSARIISEELTRAARASSYISGDDKSLCFLRFVKNEVNNENELDATKYYLDGDAIKRKNARVAVPVGSIECSDAMFNSAPEMAVSDSEVVIKKFNGSNSKPRLMELDLRIATANAISGELDESDPDNPRCNPGFEYCSMTSIQKSIMSRQNDG